MILKISRNESRLSRHARIRKNLLGTASRPRLSVYRSNTHIYAQIIDDTKGHTLVAANTKELKLGKDQKAATALGQAIAKKALKAKVKAVVFDRSGYLYTGRIQALAEAARAAGLEF